MAPADAPYPAGLTGAQAAARLAAGQSNASALRKSRTTAEILRANLLTRFNFILGALLAVILVVGPLQDALFGLVLVANAAIGVAQEVRAKRTLDRLALLSAPVTRVVRDGGLVEVARESVVLGDLVDVGRGDQVVADGDVVAGDGLELDESLLTGESTAVRKREGDRVLSGTFVVAGSGRYVTRAVGDDAYATRLAAAARRFSLVRSELMEGINRVLRYVTWAILPVAALTTLSQLHANDSVDSALRGSVAALIGMVPQGLVLLTSVAFAVAAVALARRHVLVQELPAVEALARVDVVCFDKTGTLTDGALAFDRLVALDEGAPAPDALGALAHLDGANATLTAIGERFAAPPDWVAAGRVAFSSARQWSAVDFGRHGAWVLGAPEVVVGAHPRAAAAADALAGSGERVVALARAASLAGEGLPPDLAPVALAVLSERLRPEAPATIRYFQEQGVALKVISGDNPRTVGAVAAAVGVAGADEPVDARGLPDEPDALARALDGSSVFGRVTPDQKRAMVDALRAQGHTVAMTGDGVNDVLAMKAADVGIAMGGGAAAARAVAQVVLLDDRFAQVPRIVAEGRKVAANIERVANVFLTKTAWATALAIVCGALLLPYPFLPRHLTVIDTLTIGVPCFFLALASTRRRFAAGFVARVLRFALPTGVVVAAAALAAFTWARERGLGLVEQRTAATIVTLALSLCVLVVVALPLVPWKALLVTLVAGGFVALFPLGAVRRYLELDATRGVVGVSAWCAAGGAAALIVVWRARRRASPAPTAPAPSRS